VRRRTVALALGAAAAVLGALAVARGPGEQGGGNGLVVINAGTTGVDSIVVEADPPGTHALAGRHGYLAPGDSARIALPDGRGDADVRVWRDGRVVADHLAWFGGRSLFEVRVGDAAQAGRYRRTR
jgi:hypothetical protein